MPRLNNNEGIALLKTPPDGEAPTRPRRTLWIALAVGVVAALGGVMLVASGDGDAAFVGGKHDVCHNKLFTKSTLKEAVQSKAVAGLLQSQDLKGERKASCVEDRTRLRRPPTLALACK